MPFDKDKDFTETEWMHTLMSLYTSSYCVKLSTVLLYFISHWQKRLI